MNKKVIILSLTIVATMVTVINVQQHNSDVQAEALVTSRIMADQADKANRTEQLNEEEQHVYDVCNDSRISKDINETNCGFLQDKYNMEFICKENNTSVNNMCWVEYKGTNWDKVQ